MGLSQFQENAPARRFLAVWVVALVIAVIAIGIAIAGDSGRLVLRFDRSGIGNGEYWRLLTGHFAHLGWQHTVLNLLGLAITWKLVDVMGIPIKPWAWLVIIVIGVVAVDIGLWWFTPALNWYVGLSGVSHSFLIAAAILAVRDRNQMGWLLIGILVIKVLYEQFMGPTPWSESSSGGNVVVDAHLYGVVGGVLAGFILAFAGKDAAIMRAESNQRGRNA
ncbi:MAG: rhombosortase [Pseudomonadota bacterium]